MRKLKMSQCCNSIFDPTLQLQYQGSDKKDSDNYVRKRKIIKLLTLSLFIFLCSFSQLVAQITVSGTVTDSNDGSPLTGVNVFIKGTTIGTTTDSEGKYTLEIPDENAVLSFSYIGYLKQELSFEGSNVISIIMEEDVKSLSEVVVIGYGTVKKEDLTGSVSVVTARDIQDMKVSTITEALSAKTPGVSITSNSGSPGKLPNIRIRGVSSLTNAEPLYVIDGVPVSPADAKYLNPNDIESISILKDASALAIYGARAANGIVEIVTKRGKAGKMKVNYSAYFGKQEIVKFPEMMDAYQFAYIFNDVNDLVPGDPKHLDSATIANTNWFEEMSQDAPIQNHYLSITGGGEKTIYAFSAGAFNQTGIIKNTYLKRYDLKLNTETNVKKWLKAGQDITLTYSQYRGSTEDTEWGGGQYFESMMAQPVIAPYNDSTGLWNLNPYSDAIENPMRTVDRNFRIDKTYNLNGNVYFELMPIKGLTYKSLAGLNLEFIEGDEFRPTYEIDESNRQLYPYLYKEFSKRYSYSWDNTVTFQKEIGDHSFKLMGGISIFESKSYNLTGEQNRGLEGEENEAYRFFEEYDDQAQYELVFSDSANYVYDIELFENVGGSTPEIDRVLGYLGRLEYSYLNRYLLTVNLRFDGSSNFGPDNRFGFFPGFAAAWKIHEESFMSDLDFISQLKLRIGWGKIGNDRIPKFEYMDIMNTNMGYSWGGIFAAGASPTKPSNSVLHWEESVTTNIGLDLSLFGNKLNLVSDLYKKLTKDMLWNPELPSLSGITITNSPYQNLTSMVNKGIELSVNYRQLINKVGFEAGGFIALNRMEVLDLANDGKDVIDGEFGNRRIRQFVHTREGYPVGMFYGYKLDGIFQDEDDIASSPFHGRYTKPGDLKFADLNGDNVINSSDMTFIGDPHPDFTYGFYLNIEYLGFDLGASFKGVYGQDIFVAYKAYTHNYGNPGYNFHTDVLNRWTEDNKNTDMFANNPKSSLNLASSEFYIEDGSFLRIQSMQIGYTIPVKISQLVKIEKFRVYVSGQNLLTWSKYLKYGDPDIGPVTEFYDKTDRTGTTYARVFSVDQVRTNTPRILSFGLDISF
jgi:TonB-linked SusC/RagA family outer membrane protein